MGVLPSIILGLDDAGRSGDGTGNPGERLVCATGGDVHFATGRDQPEGITERGGQVGRRVALNGEARAHIWAVGANVPRIMQPPGVPKIARVGRCRWSQRAAVDSFIL